MAKILLKIRRDRICDPDMNCAFRLPMFTALASTKTHAGPMSSASAPVGAECVGSHHSQRRNSSFRQARRAPQSYLPPDLL